MVKYVYGYKTHYTRVCCTKATIYQSITKCLLLDTTDEMDEEEGYRRVKNWVDHSKTLRIFIFGKLGAGKSTLINSLLNKDVADVGSGLDAVTRLIQDHAGRIAKVPYKSITIFNIEVTLWDTPGLQDPKVNRDSLLADLKAEVTDEEDLYVYCMQMTQPRVEQGDYDSIMDLTNTLGANFWQRSVFALTFANEVTVPPSSRGKSLEEYFGERLQDWTKCLRSAVSNADVSNFDVQNIPVIPVGYKKEHVPGLTSRDHWFTTFWATCLRRMKFMSIPAFLTVNKEEWVDSQIQNELAARVITHKILILAEHFDAKLKKGEISPQSLSGITPENMARYLKRAIPGTDDPDYPERSPSEWLMMRNSKLAIIAVASLAAVLAFLYWRRKREH